MKYFDFQNNRLVFEGYSPSPENWDKGWSNFDLKKAVEGSKNERFISGTTKTFIAPGKNKRILEGGCGLGNFVYSLEHNGYDAYGIDFAEETIRNINQTFPKLKVSSGDVRKLNFVDDYFDGYWSLGVIEHFYEGYNDIKREMRRVLKKGGYLFITFPYFSPLRKLKAKLGMYTKFDERKFNQENFYQFALDANKVIKDFENENFVLIKKRPITGLKGLKDEIKLLNKPLQYIYNNKSFFFQVLGYFISYISSRLSGHAILLVFKNNK